MSNEEFEKFKRVIVNIKEKTPILFIERAATIFLSIYKGEVFNIDIDSKEEDISRLREFLLYVPDDFTLVIKDIGILSSHFLSSLLKLIEESNVHFILLALHDINQKSAPMLYSRMKYILKFPEDTNTNNTLVRVAEALRMSEELTKEALYAEECPALYKLEYDTRYLKFKNRYVNLLGD